MAYDVHAGMQEDVHGDIHKSVAADRAKVDAQVALMAKTATEFRAELYTMFMGAYMLRDMDYLVRVAELIMEFNGWKNGGGKTAFDAENI